MKKTTLLTLLSLVTVLLLAAPLLMGQNRQMVLVYEAQPGAQWPQCRSLGTCFYDFVDLRTNLEVVWDQGFPNGTPHVDSSVDVAVLQAELSAARNDITNAQAEVALLDGQVEALQQTNADLEARIEALEESTPQPPAIASISVSPGGIRAARVGDDVRLSVDPTFVVTQGGNSILTGVLDLSKISLYIPPAKDAVAESP